VHRTEFEVTKPSSTWDYCIIAIHLKLNRADKRCRLAFWVQILKNMQLSYNPMLCWRHGGPRVWWDILSWASLALERKAQKGSWCTNLQADGSWRAHKQCFFLNGKISQLCKKNSENGKTTKKQKETEIFVIFVDF